MSCFSFLYPSHLACSYTPFSALGQLTPLHFVLATWPTVFFSQVQSVPQLSVLAAQCVIMVAHQESVSALKSSQVRIFLHFPPQDT